MNKKIFFLLFVILLVSIPTFASNFLDNFNIKFQELSDKFYGKEGNLITGNAVAVTVPNTLIVISSYKLPSSASFLPLTSSAAVSSCNDYDNNGRIVCQLRTIMINGVTYKYDVSASSDWGITKIQILGSSVPIHQDCKEATSCEIIFTASLTGTRYYSVEIEALKLPSPQQIPPQPPTIVRVMPEIVTSDRILVPSDPVKRNTPTYGNAFEVCPTDRVMCGVRQYSDAYTANTQYDAKIDGIYCCKLSPEFARTGNTIFRSPSWFQDVFGTAANQAACGVRMETITSFAGIDGITFCELNYPNDFTWLEKRLMPSSPNTLLPNKEVLCARNEAVCGAKPSGYYQELKQVYCCKPGIIGDLITENAFFYQGTNTQPIATANPNDFANVKIFIKNIGDATIAASGSIKVIITKNNVNIRESSLNFQGGFSPGNVIYPFNAINNFQFSGGGNYCIKTIVDPGNLIPESYENNNEFNSPYCVAVSGLSDLMLESANFVDANGNKVTNAVAGDTLKPRVVVKNVGTIIANNFKVKLTITKFTGLRTEKTETTPTAITLNPGESRVIDFSDYQFPEAGTYGLIANVDFENTVSEENENNNIGGEGATVTVPTCSIRTCESSACTDQNTCETGSCTWDSSNNKCCSPGRIFDPESNRCIYDPNGITVILKVGEDSKFVFNNEVHELNFDAVSSSNEVIVTVSSLPQTNALSVGRTIDANLNGDAIDDFRVRLNRIINPDPNTGSAEFTYLISDSGLCTSNTCNTNSICNKGFTLCTFGTTCTFSPPNKKAPEAGCCIDGERWNGLTKVCEEFSGSTCLNYNTFQAVPLPYEEACCQASIAYGFWYPAEVF